MLACLDMLNRSGAEVALLDCLDQTWSDIKWPKANPYGRGHYPKTELPKPDCLKDIPRKYSRYGLPYSAVKGALKRLSPPPDLVLITSIMTYWYPGVMAVANLVKDIWPKVPLVLGGIFATLCPEQASQIDSIDQIISGPLERRENWQKIWDLLDSSRPPLPEQAGFSLNLDCYPAPKYSFILGSRGCPFSCPYCANKALYPCFKQRNLQDIWSEVKKERQKSVIDFAFYDDALLVKPENWLVPLLKSLESEDIRLHTPNAVHVRYLDKSICDLFKAAGLTTIRLGLETSDFESRLDQKITAEEWDLGVKNLLASGFSPDQIGAYILFGLPGQDLEEIKRAIYFVHSYNIRPHLAFYSPIPGSPLFPEAEKYSPYPLSEEPLFQNNTIWPCYPGGFSWEEQRDWKRLLNGEK